MIGGSLESLGGCFWLFAPKFWEVATCCNLICLNFFAFTGNIETLLSRLLAPSCPLVLKSHVLKLLQHLIFDDHCIDHKITVIMGLEHGFTLSLQGCDTLLLHQCACNGNLSICNLKRMSMTRCNCTGTL